MEKKRKDLLIQFGVIFVFCVVGFWFINIMVFGFESRYVVIDSEITNIETVIDDKGKLDYLIVDFDNNETYKISIGRDDVDLTVNSNIIIELGSSYERSWFWEDFKPSSDIFYISRVIKIP